MSVATVSRPQALDEMARAFKGAMAAVRRLRGRETHKPGELSFAQYGLLFGLADGTPRSLRELAFAADVSPATAGEMLDAMAASGLVERVRSAVDRRVVLTSLTDRGRAVIEQRRATYEPHWQAVLGRFNRDELMTAAAVLDALAQMFDEFAESER